MDYLGGSGQGVAERFARRGALIALNELACGHNWSYYYARGRVNSVAQQTKGTVQYTDATLTVQLDAASVLAGITFPTWSPFGQIVITQNDPTFINPNAGYNYFIQSMPTSTSLILGQAVGADLPAGTTYTLYRDTYPLPFDFRSADEVLNLNNTGPLKYCHPRDWLNAQRLRRGPATPAIYTFTGDTRYFGGMEIKLFPAPDNVYAFDFLYQRLPRPIIISSYNAGTASLTAGSPTVNGNGTVWTPSMVGSNIRFSSDNKTKPTGRDGTNPFVEEHIILAVVNNSTITLVDNAVNNLSGNAYNISDPIDIEDGAMRSFVQREVEKQIRLARRVKATPEEVKEYESAQIRAWERDARSFARRVAGETTSVPMRLANMPRGQDVS
jgi:hypothetical protein